MRCAEQVSLAGYASWFAAVLLVACGFDDSGEMATEEDEVPTYEVRGAVVDFATRDPVAGQASVATSNLSPNPVVTVSGAAFTIAGVPPHSVFHALAGSPPTHRNSFGATVAVAERDVSGVEVPAVSEAYLAELTAAFGGDPGGAVLIARAVDEAGAPRAGVPAAAFAIDGAAPVDGPHFLDAALRPAPQLQATSASGYAVFFAVDDGLVTVTATPGSGYTMVMNTSPAALAVVTIADVTVTDGAPARPSNVSFIRDVVPIFELRGCDACHSGNGIGRDLGGLMLDASANKSYDELTREISPNHGVTRVNLQAPADSLVLTMPSPETPPDRHPNVTFTGVEDPDYQLLLVWIEEGARDN